MNPRPPSPTGSSVSRASAAVSVKSTVSSLRKQASRPSTLTATALASLPKAPSAISQMNFDECMCFVTRPHRTWDSAYKEFARIETLRQRQESDARSCCSSVSAYSIPASVASTARSSKAARKGRIGMLPLSGQDGLTIGVPREDPDLMLTGRSTAPLVPASSHHVRPSSMNSVPPAVNAPGRGGVRGGTGGFQFTTATPGNRVGGGAGVNGDDFETMSVGSSRSSTVAGAPGGLSGIRRQSGAMSAPTASKRVPSKNPPVRGPAVSKRTPSNQPVASGLMDLQVGGTSIR